MSSGPRIAGYAALFDHMDRGGDIICRGAFRHTLGRQKTWPLLWQHRQDQHIGQVIHAAEDRRGLRVIAQFTEDSKIAVKAGQMLASGAVTGLSFGYRVRSFSEAMAGSLARRQLLALDLVEVSLVTHPMQPRARIHMTDPNIQLNSPRPNAPN